MVRPWATTAVTAPRTIACPSPQLLDRIADKWVALILSALGSGPDCTGDERHARFSQLARVLAGVSQKMLTQILRALGADGLLTRTITPYLGFPSSHERGRRSPAVLRCARTRVGVDARAAGRDRRLGDDESNLPADPARRTAQQHEYDDLVRPIIAHLVLSDDQTEFESALVGALRRDYGISIEPGDDRDDDVRSFARDVMGWWRSR